MQLDKKKLNILFICYVCCAMFMFPYQNLNCRALISSLSGWFLFLQNDMLGINSINLGVYSGKSQGTSKYKKKIQLNQQKNGKQAYTNTISYMYSMWNVATFTINKFVSHGMWFVKFFVSLNNKISEPFLHNNMCC